jgi:hypothetical protein
MANAEAINVAGAFFKLLKYAQSAGVASHRSAS